jgi:hypothetical protein
MRLAVALLWTSAVLAGCSLDIKLPEGRIACSEDSDCPAHWVCSAAGPSAEGLCYRSAQLVDAGVVENEDLDAQALPAERDAEAQAKDAAVVLSMDAADAARDATIAAPLDATSEMDTGAMAPNDASRLDAGDASDASGEVSAEAATDASGLSDGSAASDASQDAAPDASANRAPTITAVVSGTRYINSGSTTAGCIAMDQDGDPLSFAWSANLGTFSDSAARSTRYVVGEVGEAILTCRVSDGRGGSVEGSTHVGVYPSGWLALLPFELSTLDMSGNAREPTIHGVFVADRHGHEGWAVQLDGAADDITLPDESAFDLDTFSVVLRLNPSALTHDRTLLSKASSSFGNFTVFLHADNDTGLPRRLQFGLTQVVGGQYSIVLGNYQVTPGSSIQFALTLSAARELRAYVDGVLIHSQNNVPMAEHNDAPVVVGNGFFGGFAGVIDEVQMYNRALTAQEVAALAGMQ